MSFPRFKVSKDENRDSTPATLATTATFEAAKRENRDSKPATFATTATFGAANENKERTWKCSDVASVAAVESRTLTFEAPRETGNVADVANVATAESRTLNFEGESKGQSDADERIESWLSVADRPQPDYERDLWERYTSATIEFATSLWASRAVEAGWNDSALFSIAIGLVPEQCRQDLRIRSIGRLGAVFSDGERFRLTNKAADYCPPWWGDWRFVSKEYAGREWRSAEGYAHFGKEPSRAPRPKPQRETLCITCLLNDKGMCGWHEIPLDPTMTLCGGHHWIAQ